MAEEIESLKRAVLGGDWSPGTLRLLADAQERFAAAAERKRLLRVGATVRVPRGKDATARAMISSLNDDETMDVVYEDGDDDEACVARSAATSVEPFEEKDAEEEECPAVLKERGSTLFKLKDYVAAARYYQRALAVIKATCGSLSVGALAMISHRNALRVGTVSCLDEKTLDVTYDDEPDDDDVPRRSVVALLPESAETRLILLTTYLNLARCASKVQRHRDAVTAATMATGIAAHDGLTDYGITAFILRARAHLAQSHLKRAVRDAARANDLDDPQSSKHPQLPALNRDLERAKRLALKANKKLAKDVSEWVSSAQSKFAEAGGSEADCHQQ